MAGDTFSAEDLFKLAGAYWGSCALHASVQTGLTAALARKPASAAAYARELGTDERATAMLCQALCALGLVEKDGDVFSLIPQAVDWLTPGHRQGQSNAILHLADMVADWSTLAERVRTGTPVDREQQEPDSRQQGRAHFYLAMRDLARNQAQGMAKHIGLQPGMKLLDLGGGPGVYGLTMTDEVPEVESTVFDLPEAEQFFRKEAKAHPHSDRVRFVPGDYRKDHLGGPYDAVWISQVLHGAGPGTCAEMIEKAAQALRPGGAMFVQEFVLDPECRENPFAALFALNMLVNTPDGQTYTAGEIIGFMTRAGLEKGRYLGTMAKGRVAGIVKGVKPA